MYFYYLIFFLPLLPIVFKNKSLISSFFIFLNLFFFIFFIGLRSEVGGDWRQLYYAANNYSGVSFYDFFSNLPTELLYASVIYFSVNLGAGIFGSNLIFAAIFVYCLHKYLKSLPYYFFSFSISVPVLVIILAMGYTQQSVAFGFCLLAILALRENKTILFVIYVLIASFIHDTAIALLVLYLASVNVSNAYKLIIPFIILLFFSFYLFEAQSLLTQIYFYIGKGTEHYSKGAFYRIGINLISAIIFLSFVRKRVLNIHDKNIYTILSFISFILLILAFHSSTFADRINFYIFPLHLYVVAHFISSFKYKQIRFSLSLITIMIYFSLLSFWLIYGNTSDTWLPYKMFPFSTTLSGDSFCLNISNNPQYILTSTTDMTWCAFKHDYLHGPIP